MPASVYLDRIIVRVALPLLAVSAAILHCYTVYVAFHLATTALRGLAAGLAAWSTPPISWFVVAYIVWRKNGYLVNTYPLFVLAWLGFVAALLSLVLAKNVSAWMSERARARSVETGAVDAE